ncbi:MAG: hypothetical protein WA364_22845 [Candidatus Nitrosopolaris sp.]
MLHEQKLTYPGKIKEILEDTIEAGKSLGMLTRRYERKYIRTKRG